MSVLIDDQAQFFVGVSTERALQLEWSGRLLILSTVSLDVLGEAAWHHERGQTIPAASPLLGVRIGPISAEPVRLLRTATTGVRRSNAAGVTLSATHAFTSDSEEVLDAMADALADALADLMAAEYVKSTGALK